MGHNFGCFHDFGTQHGGINNHQTSTNACTKEYHIMSYGRTHEKWSDCSRKDVIAHFNNMSKWCLESKLLLKSFKNFENSLCSKIGPDLTN